MTRNYLTATDIAKGWEKFNADCEAIDRELMQPQRDEMAKAIRKVIEKHMAEEEQKLLARLAERIGDEVESLTPAASRIIAEAVQDELRKMIGETSGLHNTGDGYRRILKAYIDHVRVCEGTDFIGSAGMTMEQPDIYVLESIAKELDGQSHD